MTKLAPLGTVRHTVQSGMSERMEISPCPSYPAMETTDWRQAPWGGWIALNIIGPKGGVRFRNELTPVQARAVAYALLQSADWAELEGQYVGL